MITKELGKKILLTILWLVVVTLLVLPLFINKEDKQELKRLDEISNRLSDIWLQIEDINWQIVELESQKDVLIAEQTDLNEEAQTLFLSLVTPEMVEPQEEQVAWWASIWPVEEKVNVDQLYKCAHWDWEIYRNIKWRCNSDWMAQDIPALQWYACWGSRYVCMRFLVYFRLGLWHACHSRWWSRLYCEGTT